ncbi:hypothetical protein [Pendulispora albinea]|uniref:DUF4365 domain-containing protein n=1 Tax=Pendulispora albinea TaxID=2741071 RepID=A0ABZ2LRS0_9BACT
MPASFSHEGLVLLFRNRPTLAAELLRDVLHLELPGFERVTIGEADVSQITPTERTVDLVLTLEDGDGRPELAIIVELQLHPNGDKKWSWPHYVCALRDKLRCPVLLLVVTTREDVAAWAREPIELGRPGDHIRPFVLGPSAIPAVRDPSEAERAPELAVLSAAAHGHDDPGIAVQIASAALQACRQLDDQRNVVYSDLIFISLSAAARTTFEKIMSQGNYVFQSEYFLKHLRAGREEGVEEGLAAGEAKAVIAFLEARGLPVPDETRARILTCKDISTLDRWIRKAVAVTSADELFHE